METSLLHTSVYPEPVNFKVFGEILSTLDHITPQQISRKEYETKIGPEHTFDTILEETGQDKYGKQYTLYLPDDLKHGELLGIISFLHQKFDLEKFGTSLNPLMAQTKLYLLATLKNRTLQKQQEGKTNIEAKSEVNNEQEPYFQELMATYHINEDLRKRIEDYKLAFGTMKTFISQFRIPPETPVDKGYIYDTKQMEQRLTATLSQEFDTTFFRKGIDMVRYGMETMTQAEQNAIIEYCEKEKFTKNIGDDGRIIYTKGYEEYAIKHFDLDIESKKLREKMQIDKWKKQLDDVRKTDQKKEIEQTEINATNAILQALRHYPYQLTKNNNGYQVSKILSTKELYCVGYALLGHAFLEELGIKHRGLDYPKHSALEIEIGSTLYLFDVQRKKILPFRRGKSSGVYKMIEGDGRYFEKPEVAYGGNPETILGSQIHNNKVNALCYLGRYEEALICYDKALELNPNNANVYNNKGVTLSALGRYKEALIFYDKALEFNPNDVTAYNNKGNALFNLGRYKEALIFYDKALEFNPNDVTAYNNKGVILSVLGRYEEALICYNKALELIPNDVNIHNNRAIILEKLDKQKNYKVY